MPIFTHFPISNIEGQDKIKQTEKVTAGYFPGGAGQLNAANIYTGSLADSNEAYYFNIADKHPDSSSVSTVFSVAYGDWEGSGSLVETDTKSESQTVYRQWAQRLLTASEVTGGFYISSNGTSAAQSGRDKFIYILVGKRERFKDRINPKNWIVALSGSSTMGTAATAPPVRYYTDDSDTVNATQTPAGPRHNIVSASSAAGTSYIAASTRTIGWIYPDAGVLVFSGAELSASIPGFYSASQADIGQTFIADGYRNDVLYTTTGSLGYSSSMGFAPSLGTADHKNNALRFVNCLRGNTGGLLKFRSEELQTSVSYFCRLRAGDANFSNNQTFVSGSENKIRHTAMAGNPQTFITAVGLEDQNENLIAVAKLSKPLRKNFSSEATIKVKLTY